MSDVREPVGVGSVSRGGSAAPADRRFGLIGHAGSLFAGSAAAKSVLALADQGVIGLTNFLTVVLIGRVAAPEELGNYALALSALLLARSVQEALLIAPYAVYCHAEDRASVVKYAGSTFAHQCLLSAFTVVCLAAFAFGLWVVGSGTGLGSAILIAALASPLILLREFARQMAFAHLEAGSALGVDVIVGLVQLTLVAVLGAMDLLTATTAYAAVAVACATALVGWAARWRHRLAIERSRLIADFRKNWRFGKWGLGAQALGTSLYLVMPWLVTAHHGVAAAGLFAAANTVAGLANTLLLGLSNVLTPRAAGAYAVGGASELRRVLRQFAVLFGATVGPFAALLVLWGTPVASFVYDGRYADAGPIIGILAASLLVSCVGILAGNGLWALHRPAATFWADLARFVTAIGLAVWLVPAQGVEGAALAMLAGATLNAVLNGGMFLVLLTRNSHRAPKRARGPTRATVLPEHGPGEPGGRADPRAGG